MTLIAEDLLLLLLDDESGRPVVDSTKFPRALAGALMLDLALPGAVRVTERGEEIRKDRLVLAPGATPPSDPIASDALAMIATARPMKPKTAIDKLAKGLRERLASRAERDGWVREDKGKILGLFPTTTWPASDRSRKQTLQSEIRSALIDGTTPLPRTTALISMLSAVDATAKVFPGEDRKAMKRRAKEIAEGEWAGVAVRKAVEAVNAAVTAAIVVAASAGASSGS